MDMVLVGCKLPSGLIMELPPEVTKDNFMQVQQPGKQYTIKGAATLFNQRTKRAPAGYDFAMTPVPKDFAEAWFKRYRELPMVKNGLVFVAEKQDRANGIAKERSDLRTGLEPLDGSVDRDGHPKDPRFTRQDQNPEFAEPMGI